MVPNRSGAKESRTCVLGRKLVSMAKNVAISTIGGPGGDFYKDIYEQILFGKHRGSVLRGLNAGKSNTELKMSILPILSGGERVRTLGQKGRFFDVWRSWRGLL